MPALRTSRFRSRGIGSALVVVAAVLAIAFGAWQIFSAPPGGLPTSGEEAVRVVSSDRFARLSPDRQQQYLQASARIVKTAPESRWAEWKRDPSASAALERIFDAAWREELRAAARGEVKIDFVKEAEKSGGTPGDPRENDRESASSVRREKAAWFDAQASAGNPQDFGLVQENAFGPTGDEEK